MKKLILSLTALGLSLTILFAQKAELYKAPHKIVLSTHSDNGNGTYTNPVINADFPDPDVILVGDTYYMVTTTMFIFPGVTVLKSYDLVNWEYCSNAVPRFDFSPCYDLDTCNRYMHGQWATSLKYNKGKFYIFLLPLMRVALFVLQPKLKAHGKLKNYLKVFTIRDCFLTRMVASM